MAWLLTGSRPVLVGAVRCAGYGVARTWCFVRRMTRGTRGVMREHGPLARPLGFFIWEASGADGKHATMAPRLRVELAGPFVARC